MIAVHQFFFFVNDGIDIDHCFFSTVGTCSVEVDGVDSEIMFLRNALFRMMFHPKA